MNNNYETKKSGAVKTLVTVAAPTALQMGWGAVHAHVCTYMPTHVRI